MAFALLVVLVVLVSAGAFWLDAKMRDWTYDQAEKARETWEREKYRAVDFGGVASAAPVATGAAPEARPAAPPADLAPMTPQPTRSVLRKLSADSRSAWAKVAEALLLTLCTAAFIILMLLGGFTQRGWSRHDDTGAPAAVGEVLELHGYAGARVEKQWWLAKHCRPNSFAYRWSAAGAEGRACVHRWDGQIKVKVLKAWGPAPKAWTPPAETPAGT